MAFDLRINVQGLLRFYTDPQWSAGTPAAAWQNISLQPQSNASFLITLASLELQTDAGPVYHFFRDLIKSWLLKISALESCQDHDRQLGELLEHICRNYTERAEKFADAIPPCPGSELAASRRN